MEFGLKQGKIKNLSRVHYYGYISTFDGLVFNFIRQHSSAFIESEYLLASTSYQISLYSIAIMLCWNDYETIKRKFVLYSNQSHSLTGNFLSLFENAIYILLSSYDFCLRKASSHQKL